MSRAASVRERFSLEFVSANLEAAAQKELYSVEALPELVLFDPDFVSAPPVSVAEPSFVDPIDELRMLFGSVNQ